MYTFQSLSDADLEDLACDLLQASLGIRFQSFPKGRDSGIDLLHGLRSHGGTVVQCKHYCRSKFANLKSVITKDELPKLAKLKPDRFILVTSLPLTPQNKEDLFDVLGPYCKGIDDIYGPSDLNALLRQHTHIERAHYKLWLTSTTVLQRVLRHGAVVWNAMTREDIERKMSLYVQTKAYDVALSILANHHYCILSGIPGIGKTTLAQVLVTQLMDEDFELIAVRDDIQEVFDVLDTSRKQVVYYDDFLGQSSFRERLGKNEDRGIIRLLTEARRSKHLAVIFTTREYILEDAKQVYEPLTKGDLDVAKCVVKVEDYTRGHRARILYNHVYFSDLSRTYATALLKDRGYRKIIDHDGYSPRIVEWMTVGAGPSGVKPDQYVDRFIQVLDDPTQLWQHAFENQIDEAARAIMYCLGSVQGAIGLGELRELWGRLRELKPAETSSIENKRMFQGALKQLDGSFLRTDRAQSEITVEFHNPSIKDFVRRRIVSDKDTLRELVRTALFFEQLVCLVHLSPNGRIEQHPSLLIKDDRLFHEAIRRTLDAKSGTYEWVTTQSDRKRRLARNPADVGKRLTTVANWASGYESPRIFELVTEIAMDMAAAGDLEKAATMGACGFLTALIGRHLQDQHVVNVVKPFLIELEKILFDLPSTGEWSKWTDFLNDNPAIYSGEQMTEWKERAHEFCVSEAQVVMENAATSTEAQEWYEEIVGLADKWNVSLEENGFEDWLRELTRREEARETGDYDWGWERSVGPVDGSDADVDRLFLSLSDRASD